MGYQRSGLEDWQSKTSVEIVERLRDEQVDALLLAPA